MICIIKFQENFDYSFLFESLTGPEELAETSIMGFDPPIVAKCFADRVILHYKNGTSTVIETKDPLSEIKKLLYQVSDQKYRYVGGAVGAIQL
ncbi:Anthranilate synthase, aminase component [Candidatus Nitrosotalea sp. TS]|uniref:hypothetical protein n=1 Tax=Candidatus Nitrosotalea sp. TS TaxID=2341020 RepID=UPI001ED3BE21|nr:hypothetical protein [Candidatus Nitrosotalea sp. TS]NHI02895.1 Anthranilate synthase, aminase component [Candidatus Nitrosotalea sp. TS]